MFSLKSIINLLFLLDKNLYLKSILKRAGAMFPLFVSYSLQAMILVPCSSHVPGYVSITRSVSVPYPLRGNDPRPMPISCIRLCGYYPPHLGRGPRVLGWIGFFVIPIGELFFIIKIYISFLWLFFIWYQYLRYVPKIWRKDYTWLIIYDVYWRYVINGLF